MQNIVRNEKIKTRERFIKLRNGIPEAKRLEYSRIIFDKIISSDDYKNAESVFCYISMKSETKTHDIINKAIEDGKITASPVLTAKPGRMEFRTLSSLDETVKSRYGALEPVNGEIVFPNEKTLIIVPGLAFTRDGRRIGYGGGYYDRYLAMLSSKKACIIGICYGIQITGEIPVSKRDMRMGAVISELD